MTENDDPQFEDRREYRAAMSADGLFRLRLTSYSYPATPPDVTQLRALFGDLPDNIRVVSGYASVTDHAYPIQDSFGQYNETIAPGAFAETLREHPAVVHRVQHLGLGLSSTESGTLDLREDEVGLHFRSLVDVAETDAADLVNKLERKVVTQTSFAFRIRAHEWNEAHDALTIRSVDLDGGDVASVAYGANPAGAHGVEPTPEPVAEIVDEPAGNPQRARVSRPDAINLARSIIVGYDLDKPILGGNR